MPSNKTVRLAFAVVLILVSAVWSACNKTAVPEVSASASNAQIPITTKSDDARKEFLQGRDLSERLLGQDSLQHFDKALALDPDFASAELARANNSPTTKEFFLHMQNAVNLANRASEGEKLVILANQAGANGNTVQQKDYLDKLIAAYPNDERVQFALANYYFGQQELDQAVAHYKKCTELAPSYSPAYNVLGYAYRQQGNYADAEQAFKKYIELIPNDPNPYDSYAELLLKEGKFDDSIAQYRKALSIDPHFASSRFGISADLMYSGKSDEANSELQGMADQARNDGEFRTALFGMAVVAADGGKYDKAIQAMDKEYAVAEKRNDVASMAADLQAKGNILAAMPKYNEAKQTFDRSFQMIQASSLSQEIKDNSALLRHYNLAGLAISQKDFAAAKLHADEFRQGVAKSNNHAQEKQSHELAGRIALAQKDYDAAITELAQANDQDPRNLYRLAEAYQGKGDNAKAEEFRTKAADFNSLPALPYAFVRAKTRKVGAGKEAS
ncbi:MAG TPA: tetratricopeptide repeat protein [Candidatus Acidoferrales bacterium]